MSYLVVLGFDNTETARAVLKEAGELQKQHLIDLEDAAIVIRDSDGQPKIEQAVNLTAAGAVSGGFWGLLVGALFLNPLLGAAVGAGAGALSGSLQDIGINDDTIKEIGGAIQPGASALFVLVRQATPDKVIDELKKYNPTVIQTSLSHDDEARLVAALMPKTPDDEASE